MRRRAPAYPRGVAVDTASRAIGVPALGVAPRWLQRIFWANLIAQIGIVITGGIVRVTGSGLGCPTWPECVDGSITPTDDQAETLIGVGASSISRFPQGYSQNSASTSTHTKAIRDGAFSTARGHVFSQDDKLRGRIIEALMCDFRVSNDELMARFDVGAPGIEALCATARATFGDMVEIGPEGFAIPERARPLTRMIARTFDAYDQSKARHSQAV